MSRFVEEIRHEVAKWVVGQQRVVDALLIALATEGHLLLESVPGLAKTTAVKAFAAALGFDFKRVQFTPDLLPSDILGVQVYDRRTNEFHIKKGPIFTNILLADEINRAPSKVQSALLEAMAERQVTIAEESFEMARPFLVLATQNPIEQEGVYALPEAQLDRFMMKIKVDYPTPQEELEIMRRAAIGGFEEVKQVATAEGWAAAKKELAAVHIDLEVQEYIVRLIDATRHPARYKLDAVVRWLEFGASPRATIDLLKASRAEAWLRGRDFVTPVDVAAVLPHILRHRLILSYEAMSDGVDADQVISALLQGVRLP
ncbi:MAG: MoxR family ATPase [Campylobacterales bacterium]